MEEVLDYIKTYYTKGTHAQNVVRECFEAATAVREATKENADHYPALLKLERYLQLNVTPSTAELSAKSWLQAQREARQQKATPKVDAETQPTPPSDIEPPGV